MALTKCPECELQVSDKALTCPHCGYPLVQTEYIKSKKKGAAKRKRMRLPNGFGRITEIKGKNLRKPFRAMVTTGHDELGRPIAKLLKPEAYFATYNEAYAALVEYNKDPYELESDTTVAKLYEQWLENYKKGVSSDSAVRSITAAWAYCKEISGMRARDLRARHIKGVIEEGYVLDKSGDKRYASPSTKSRIKNLFNMMLDYAVEYEITDKNYARTFVLSEEVANLKKNSATAHMIFTPEEMDRLWENLGIIPYVNVVLLQCYSGWRPVELGLIRLENVDLTNWTMIGGLKTESGYDRLVPIHPKIRHIVKDLYDEAVSLGSERLINCTDTHTHRSSLMFTYNKYHQRFQKIKFEVGLNHEHKCHDARKHFVTMCKNAGVDEYAIKYMVGHIIKDITEAVYTDRKHNVEWLSGELAKVP